jgi:amino acid permease
MQPVLSPPGLAPVKAPVGLIVLAWALGLAGVCWAYLIALATAMMTAPRMSLGAALWSVPLPALAVGACVAVIRCARRGAAPRASAFWVVPALLLAAVGLLIGIAAHADMGR